MQWRQWWVFALIELKPLFKIIYYLSTSRENSVQYSSSVKIILESHNPKLQSYQPHPAFCSILYFDDAKQTIARSEHFRKRWHYSINYVIFTASNNLYDRMFECSSIFHPQKSYTQGVSNTTPPKLIHCRHFQLLFIGTHWTVKIIHS